MGKGLKVVNFIVLSDLFATYLALYLPRTHSFVVFPGKFSFLQAIG